MTDNVVKLFDEELTADEVLEKAKGNLSEVLVISYDKGGCIDVRSTNMDAKSAAYIAQQFLQQLYNGDFSE